MNSEIEEYMNTIMATMTKLRAHIRKLRMAETSTEDMARQVPLYYCTCPTEIPCPVHDKNYQIIRERLGMAGTEPERCKKCGYYLIEAYTSGRKHCPHCLQEEMSGLPDFVRGAPDLPLSARVADLIGWDRPKKLTIEWAMEALEEYCDKIKTATILTYSKDGWQVNLAGCVKRNKILSQAICEAIANHAETK